MGVRLSIRVQLVDGTPVPGAQINGTNHDSWSKKHRSWPATTGPDGTYTWDSIDKGTLGDRYTFEVVSTDSKGVMWVGSASFRAKRDSELVVTLHKEGSTSNQVTSDGAKTI